MSDLTPSEVVEELLTGTSMLFRDQYGTAYIAPSGNGSDVMKIHSSDFKHWLSGRLYKEYGKVVSANTLNSVIQVLSGTARHENRVRQLSVRISFDGNTLLYDLGDEVIEVDKSGWRLTLKQPIAFRRYPHQKNQSFPEEGGSVNDLLKFTNIKNEDECLLFLVFTVLAFLPGFPHPLLLLHGPQGSGKSTPMRLLKELVDPSAIQGLSAPKDEPSFVQLAHHHAFVVFDNLSNIPVWFSDALARASTGDGFSKRALYTDDDDVVYKIQRTIALNGINQVVTKADLLDRSILIGLKRIEPTERMPEDIFWKTFHEEKPNILGAIFSVLSKAIGEIGDLELTDLPRMADFAKWGYVVAEVMGYGGEKFITAYKSNISRQNEEAIEASPVAQAVIEFMHSTSEWSGTAGELLRRLNQISAFNDLKSSMLWPKDPQWLSKRLNEVEPNLQAAGIYFDRFTRNQQRILIIKNGTVNDNNDKNTVSTSEVTN